MTRTARHIALDGDFNGYYIDAKTAQENGYTLSFWQWGESAYLHSSRSLGEPESLTEVAELAMMDE